MTVNNEEVKMIEKLVDRMDREQLLGLKRYVWQQYLNTFVKVGKSNV